MRTLDDHSKHDNEDVKDDNDNDNDKDKDKDKDQCASLASADHESLS
jgi:hypothetical protein